MPKVTYNSKKGLIQEAGAGFTVSNGPVVLGATSLTGATALSTSNIVTLVTADGVNNVNALADGTVVGEIIYVVQASATSARNRLTPVTTLGAYNYVQFDEPGHGVKFMWTDDGWAVLGRCGGDNAMTDTQVRTYPALV